MNTQDLVLVTAIIITVVSVGFVLYWGWVTASKMDGDDKRKPK